MLESRLKRVEELLGKQLAQIVGGELSDPRLEFANVTRVRVAKDLSDATVFVSLLDDDPALVAPAMAALTSAEGHVKRVLASRVALRRMPKLHFRHDTATGEAFHLIETLDAIKRETPPPPADPPPPAETGQDENGEPDTN